MLRYVCHSHSSICWRFIDQRFYIHFWKRHWTLNEYISVHMIDGLTRYMNVFFFFLCTYSTWNRSFAPWMFGQFTHPAADTLLILSAFYWSKWIPGTSKDTIKLSVTWVSNRAPVSIPNHTLRNICPVPWTKCDKLIVKRWCL